MLLHPDRRRGRRGFTLIELVIAVLILVVLAAISVVAYNHFVTGSRTTAAAASAAQIRAAVQARAVQEGAAPGDLVDQLWTASGGDSATFLSELGVSFDGTVDYSKAAPGRPAALNIGAGAAGCAVTLPAGSSSSPSVDGCSADLGPGPDPVVLSVSRAPVTLADGHMYTGTTVDGKAVTGAYKPGIACGPDRTEPCLTITGSTNSNKVTFSSGAQDVVFQALSLSSTNRVSPVTIEAGAGEVTIRLSGSTTLYGPEGWGSGIPALVKSSPAMLTFTDAVGDRPSDGQLRASGFTDIYNGSSAIVGSNVTFAGGTVTLTGATCQSSGCRAGSGIAGSNITVSGGTVTANGGNGYYSGGIGGSGIGGSGDAPASNITVSGGTVIAYGGSGYKPGAAIGGGVNSSGSTNNRVVPADGVTIRYAQSDTGSFPVVSSWAAVTSPNSGYLGPQRWARTQVQ